MELSLVTGDSGLAIAMVAWWAGLNTLSVQQTASDHDAILLRVERQLTMIRRPSAAHVKYSKSSNSVMLWGSVAAYRCQQKTSSYELYVWHTSPRTTHCLWNDVTDNRCMMSVSLESWLHDDWRGTGHDNKQIYSPQSYLVTDLSNLEWVMALSTCQRAER